MIQGEGFVISERKFDYFFGRVASSPHNQARSLSNLVALSKLGIIQELGGEEKLLQAFQAGLDAPEIRRIFKSYGVTVVKSLEIEGDIERGALEISYFYREGNFKRIPEVVSLIPKIDKREDS